MRLNFCYLFFGNVRECSVFPLYTQLINNDLLFVEMFNSPLQFVQSSFDDLSSVEVFYSPLRFMRLGYDIF